MHVTPDDLSGAVKQLHGLESGGRHLQEVREAIGGLREFLADMRGAMSDPHLTVAERNLYSRFIGLASRALDAAEAAMGR